jgi:hypothetical protein
MKTVVEQVDATPTKRLFLSIIADYDLTRSVSELIDNALDLWITNGKKQPVRVEVNLNKVQQTICVTDNVGGVNKPNLKFIVGPGQTGNLPEAEIIGIFGVGTKRAVVALSQDITITTRCGKDKTFQVEFDDNWLKSDDWSLDVYEVDEIPPGTTIISLQKLRLQLTDEVENRLKDDLGAIYARFLVDKRVNLIVNSEPIKPITFESWSYPPSYQPRRYTGKLQSQDGGTVNVDILAGLSSESSPASGEYGVYLYCNDRLICRALKTHDVGFIKGLAGQPHPSISLARVIISLYGPARLMPWNSSKSGIATNHNVFLALQNFIIQVVKDYSSLSRRLEGLWPDRVLKYKTGDIVPVQNVDFPQAKKSYLPPLPRSKIRYGDLCQFLNKKVASSKPWTVGLFESIIATDLISNQRLNQKNRIALILLDSTLEIALKDFLVNESGHYYSDIELVKLFKSRKDVLDEVEKYKPLSSRRSKIDYYYGLRCKLVHERSSVGIPDSEISDYRSVVQYILSQFFGLKFSI